MIKISQVGTGQELFTLGRHTNTLNSAAFSPDGRFIVTTSLDKKAVLWDASIGSELLTFSGHNEAIESAAFSPDPTRLVTAGTDGTLKIWDLAPSHEVLTLFHPTGNPSWFAKLPDGAFLVMTGDSSSHPEVWQFSQKFIPAGKNEVARKLLTLNGHTDYVRGLTFRPGRFTYRNGQF